jgi:hypothetical protein
MTEEGGTGLPAEIDTPTFKNWLSESLKSMVGRPILSPTRIEHIQERPLRWLFFCRFQHASQRSVLSYPPAVPSAAYENLF